MTFPILGGNSAVAGGYSIDNSLRFNDDDGTSLDKTFGSAGNRRTWTWSGWIKLGNNPTTSQSVFVGYTGSATQLGFSQLGFTSNKLFFSGWSYLWLRTNQLFRDNSAWYHVVLAVDTTQATADDRVKMYVNGTEITDFDNRNNPSQNDELAINSAVEHNIGSRDALDTTDKFDGYLAEINHIDGQQLTPTSFGEFDEDSGIWKPIQYTGSYGTNGFYLDFENSGSLGADQSGNGNNFTPTNLASTDQTTDTPTNNFATMNPLARINGSGNTPTFSEGNLQLTTSDATSRFGIGSITTTGKYYFEAKITSLSASDSNQRIGIISENSISTSTDYASFYQAGGVISATGESNGSGSSWSVNDIIGVAVDMADSNTVKYYLNGSLQATMSVGASYQSLSTVPTTRQLNATNTFQMNFGNPPYTISSGNSDDNGYGNFEYAPPSGYLALCTQNLATELSPTIDDGSQYFNTVLYTGDGTDDRSITNDANAGDFSPDFLWVKNRTSANGHALVDTTRGATKVLRSQATNAEETEANGIQAFETDGFEIGTSGLVNTSGNNYVAWQWKASGGTTSSNTSGSITSTVQANTTAGFSIVTYTGTGSQATVGHGLGVTPKMIIWKRRDSGIDWSVQGTQSGMDTDRTELTLNSTGAISAVDSRLGRQSQWSSTTFEVNTYTAQNASGGTYVAYCFAEIEGYSKYGSYTGTGNSDGPMVFCGFRPSWVMVKRTDSAYGWCILDSSRNTYNVADDSLFANLSNAEDVTTNDETDFLSNGFKQRNTGGSNNASGGTYIYMAFAENPFVTSSGVPVVAR